MSQFTQDVEGEGLDDVLMAQARALTPARPSSRFYQRMAQAPWTVQPKSTGGGSMSTLVTSRRLGMRLVGLCLLAFAVIGLVPPFRAAASQLTMALFSRAESDSRSVPVAQAPTPTIDTRALSTFSNLHTVAEAERLVHFAIQVPTHVPSECHLQGARYNAYEPQRIALTYTCSSAGQSFQVIQEQAAGHPSSIGASARVERVQLKETVGEYVQGRWEYDSVQGRMVWREEPGSYTLRWQTGEFALEINGQGFAIDELTSIANSMP